MATDLKQTRHTSAKEGPAPTQLGLCPRPPSETSTSCLSFPSGPWDVHQPPPQVSLHAHMSGVSKHGHRHITTGTKLCHWHLGTRSEAGLDTALTQVSTTRPTLILPTTSWSCHKH